jgi:hypothetical protein
MMEIISLFNEFGARLIPHFALTAWFKDLQNPNDKIHRMMEEGKLIPVKRGLYFLNHELTGAKPSPILIGNHIYGPSYVSLDYALQHYQAIPEIVFSVTSVTPKISKVFETPFGRFNYYHVPLNYFKLGIQQIAVMGNLFALMAIPEKALLDKLVITKGVILRSMKDANSYFIDDLRMDEEWLRGLDTSRMETFRQVAPKAASIEFLIQLIKKL